MILDALLKWPDPSAAFNEAAAKIVPQPESAKYDDGAPIDPSAPKPSEPVDQVDLSAQAKAANDDTPLLPSPGLMADVRNMSPRALADFSHELYIEGVLSWEEYRMVGFPPELNPKYDETIGALTGEKAEPDKPRDMIADWERRVDFQRTYAPEEGSKDVTRTERILNVLKWHEIPKIELQI